MATEIINNGTQIINNEGQIPNGGTQILGGGTQVIGGGTQVLGGGTQVIGGGTQVLGGGTQVIGGGTQVVSNNTTGSGTFFSGGLLQINEEISGWKIESKINVQSGEADLYIANKDGNKGVIKYYKRLDHPKNELLESLVGLNHPDIINIYEYGEYKGRFYEIMEYAAGGALDAKNEDGTYEILPLPEDKVLQICKEVVNSFKTIHEKGIIHRDIKPGNIYYRDAERTDVVIGDFGISSFMKEKGETVSHKTQTGSRTTGYAAPEILSGIITPKMDYYALGITLWELATGKNPFTYENGKQRNEAHLLRDTIEGRIVDDILSREPILSDNLQHLIRGLLVLDEKKRWGYEEVIKHLNGEFVEVAKNDAKVWEYTLGDTVCTSLEELGVAIANDIDGAMKPLYRNIVSGFLEDKYPEIVKKMDEILEDASAKNEYKAGILKIVWLLKPDYPFKTEHGFEAKNIDDILELLIDHPDEMLPLIKDYNSLFYPYIEHLNYGDKVDEIKEIAKNIDKENGWRLKHISYWVAIILKDKIIKPFNKGRYKEFELCEFEQLDKVPSDLRNHVVNLIKNKNAEGLLFPWITLMSAKNIDWDNFRNWDDIKLLHSKKSYCFVSQDGRGDYDSITDALNAVEDGVTIELKSGTYNENIKITKDITLISKGNEPAVICIDCGDTCEITSAAKVSNIKFENKNKNKVINDSDALVTISNNCIIENCIFSNSLNNGLKVTGDNNKPIINNSIFNNSKCSGIFITGKNEPEISNCKISSGKDGIFIDEESGGVIKECNIDSVYVGINNLSNVKIISSKISSCKEAGIYNHGKGVEVEHTEIYGSAVGIKNEGTGGIYKNCSIYSNNNGVQACGASFAIFDDCKIYNNNEMGFSIIGDIAQLKINKTTIEKNGDLGVSCCNQSSADFDNCNVKNNNGGGICFYGAAKGNIKNTQIIDNNYIGVMLYGNSSTNFNDCNILNAKTLGVLAWENAKSCFTNCSVKNSLLSNMELKENSVIDINNCTIDSSLKNGIYIHDNSTVTCTDCSIKDNKGYGTVIGGKSTFKKNNCTIEGNSEGNKKISGN